MRSSLRVLLALSVCLVADRASARPLALDLDVPQLVCPLLFGQVPPAQTAQPMVPPPPVVLQPGPAQQGPETMVPSPPPGVDDVKLKDGRTIEGKILYQVQNGLLFRETATQQTYVVPYSDIVDVQQGKLVLPMPGGSIVPDRKLFLEAQIREVKARYDSLSLWPPIEELVAGVLGIVGGVLFLVLLPGEDIDYLFAALLAIPGGISLVAGTIEMASVVRRQNELQEQLDHLQAQLGQLKAAALPALPQVVAFRF